MSSRHLFIDTKEGRVHVTPSELDNYFLLQPHMVHSVSRDGTILNVSKACETLLGRTVESLSGQSFLSLYPKYRHDMVESAFNEIMQGKSVYHVKSQLTRNWGSLINVDMTTYRVLDENGEFVQTLTHVFEKEELTEIKAAFLSLLLGHAYDMGTSRDLNPAKEVLSSSEASLQKMVQRTALVSSSFELKRLLRKLYGEKCVSMSCDLSIDANEFDLTPFAGRLLLSCASLLLSTKLDRLAELREEKLLHISFTRKEGYDEILFSSSPSAWMIAHNNQLDPLHVRSKIGKDAFSDSANRSVITDPAILLLQGLLSSFKGTVELVAQDSFSLGTNSVCRVSIPLLF